MADHMSARVDQLTAELAAGRAMAERGLAAELARMAEAITTTQMTEALGFSRP
jgi:hypothetical protein